MAFAPTYQDYLQFGNFGGSENAGTPGTEQWWNSLDPSQQFQLIGGNLYIHPGDSRYAGLAETTKPADGRDIVAFGPQNTNFDNQFVDPSRVYQGGGITATSTDNQTPYAQHSDSQGIFRQFLMGAGMLLGGGLGANALLGYNGGAGLLGGASGAAGGDISPGMLSNFDTSTVGSLNTAGLDSAMQGLGYGASGDVTLPSLMNNFSVPTTGSEAMNTAGLQNVLNGLGGAPVADLSTNAATKAPVTDLSVNSGGALANIPGLSSIGGLSGLLRIAGLGTSLYGLLGHHGSSGGNNNGGGNGNGGGGGGGAAWTVNRGPYTPNPITQQQLANFRYAQPTGLLGGR